MCPRTVTFNKSDIEGKPAIFIRVGHEDGSFSCLKLVESEIRAALNFAVEDPEIQLTAQVYPNVGNFLSHLTGLRIEGFAQNLKPADGKSRELKICLENDNYLTFRIGADGFSYSGESPETEFSKNLNSL